MKYIIRMNWHCIFLKTEQQDQCLQNTFQIARDLERKLFLHHNIDLLGFQLAWLDIIWMKWDFGDKTQKIREDLTGLGTTWIDMTWNLGRGLKATWIVNNSVCGTIFKKMNPYYVYTRHEWHSSKIWSKTKNFEILAILTRGLGFELSHQDQELIL